ncbi:MAG: glycosyl hydrolase, partial [Pseudomonadota bacterium]
ERTQKKRYIVPYPERVYGEDAKNLKYRANWNPPVITSPHDHSVVYYGTQFLLKSVDRGMNWEEVSPDLTRNNPDHLGRNGGPLTPENVGAEYYHTIYYIVESKNEEGTLWVGADDGLLHLTRDGGSSWTDVSPPHRGEAMINAIELSPHTEGTAYVAVTGYKLNDFKPYIYQTKDHGKRWIRIDRGLPDGAFVRVVREDPTVAGLLYAGTEKGLFVSWDDGARWQPVELNLPAVPITDVRVREDALALSTQGRAFWVLDDLFVIREAARASVDDLYVYTPPSLTMGRPPNRAKNHEGENPSADIPIYYYLAKELGEDDVLTLEIFDAKGTLVRQYSSKESAHDRCRLAGMDPRSPFTIEYPATSAGLQRWDWDMQATNLPCVDGHFLFDGYSGPSVAPGRYSARISAGTSSVAVPLEVLPDPRVNASEAELIGWVSMQNRVTATLVEVLGGLEQAKTARSDLQQLAAKSDDAAFQELTQSALEAINQWEAEVTELRHKTLEDEDAWVMKIDGQLRHLLGVIESGGAPVTTGAQDRYADLVAQWSQLKNQLREITTKHLQVVNDWASAHSVPHVNMFASDE